MKSHEVYVGTERVKLVQNILFFYFAKAVSKIKFKKTKIFLKFKYIQILNIKKFRFSLNSNYIATTFRIDSLNESKKTNKVYHKYRILTLDLSPNH